MPATRERRSTLLPTASWDQLPRKTHDSAAVRETALSLREKENGGKICSGGVGGSSQLSRPAGAPAAMQGNWPMLAQQSQDSDPIPVEPEILRLKTFSTGLSRTKKH